MLLLTIVTFRATLWSTPKVSSLPSRRWADGGGGRRGRGQDLALAGDAGRDAHTQGRASLERVRIFIGVAVAVAFPKLPFAATLTRLPSLPLREMSVAYVSQHPWLTHATLRDNVVFGKQLLAKRYNRVIQACALAPDIEILPGG